MASTIASVSSSSNVPFGRISRHQSENNILKLKLKKPKSWNWELSTSKSSANINFPRILLYDSNNKLLADVDEADFVVNGKENELHTPVHHSLSDINKNTRLRKSCSFTVLNSSLNSPRTSNTLIRSDHSNDRDSSFRSENRCVRSHSINSQYTIQNAEDGEHDDVYASSTEEEKKPEVPIYIYSAKGLVKRDFNAKEFDGIRNKQLSLDDEKSSASITRDQSPVATNDSNVITETNNALKQTVQSNATSETNPLSKCKSVADILVNGVTRKKSRRKIRRTKSANLSTLAKCQIKNVTRNQSSSSSENESKQMSPKPAYHIQKSAAGTLIVPEEKPYNRHVRRRHRSKSTELLDISNLENQITKEKFKTVHNRKPFSICDIVDEFPSHNRIITKADNFMSNVFLSHELDSTSASKHSLECVNDLNEIIASVNSENDDGKTYKNGNASLVSNKNENNQANVKNSRTSLVNANNNVNNCTARKQRKSQLNRKVSFVQFNCEESNGACNGNIHNDWIDVQPHQQQQQQHHQPNGDLNKNGKCINARAMNGRKKVFHGKIKKSASVTGFFNSYSTIASSSDSDDNDAYGMPPVRNRKRRISQRPKSTISSYQRNGELIKYVIF